MSSTRAHTSNDTRASNPSPTPARRTPPERVHRDATSNPRSDPNPNPDPKPTVDVAPPVPRNTDPDPLPLDRKKTDGLTPDALVAELRDAGVGYVLLAGYLRLIPPQLCRAYEDKMLNIHPALLPAFGGKGMHGHHVHEAVVASGVRFTGPTVHFVNEEFDKGKIVAQRHVRVAPSDSADDVAANVLRLEHEVFSHVVSALVDGRIRFRDGDGVPVIVGEDGVEE